jgi:hypothetical protein
MTDRPILRQISAHRCRQLVSPSCRSTTNQLFAWTVPPSRQQSGHYQGTRQK